MIELLTAKQAYDIIQRFSDHKPIPELNQEHRYKEIKLKAREFAFHLIKECPESSELTMAFTYLDQAVMNACAAIARNEKVKD